MSKANPDYTVNGRASVCTWELTFSFLDKRQGQRFVKSYIQNDIPVEISYSHNDEGCSVTVSGLWANNLAHLAKTLERSDWKQ